MFVILIVRININDAVNVVSYRQCYECVDVTSKFVNRKVKEFEALMINLQQKMRYGA